MASRAGCGIRLYRFLSVAISSTLCFGDNVRRNSNLSINSKPTEVVGISNISKIRFLLSKTPHSAVGKKCIINCLVAVFYHFEVHVR